MKKAIFPTILMIIVIIFGIITSKNTPAASSAIMDEDYLKNEMKKSVMEFIEDTGANPDSCYIPFS